MERLKSAVAAVVCGLLALSGCVWIAPTRPYDRGYVVVDDGPILRNFCGVSFVQVRVTQVGSHERGAYWEAIASSPLASLPLLSQSVPGYQVTESGVLNTSKPLLIGYTETGGGLGSVVVNIDTLRAGQVAFSGGVEDRGNFERRWRTDFGCSLG